jgi:hypothetical protein
MMNWEGFEGKRSLPTRGTIPAFAWLDYDKARKISIRIANVPDEIRTENFPDTGLDFYRHANPLSPG